MELMGLLAGFIAGFIAGFYHLSTGNFPLLSVRSRNLFGPVGKAKDSSLDPDGQGTRIPTIGVTWPRNVLAEVSDWHMYVYI